MLLHKVPLPKQFIYLRNYLFISKFHSNFWHFAKRVDSVRSAHLSGDALDVPILLFAQQLVLTARFSFICLFTWLKPLVLRQDRLPSPLTYV